MNKQINISTFHSALGSKANEDSLLNVLRKIREVKDPRVFSQIKNGPKPLGAWAGWSL
jgi:hypothetical protein